MPTLNPSFDYLALGLTALVVVLCLVLSFWLERAEARRASTEAASASASHERAR